MLTRNRMRLKEYRKARNRVNRGKLGVFPLIDKQGLYSIYLLHSKIRVMQHICDKILSCPRFFIHRKRKFFYVKLLDYRVDKWVEYMKENSWKKL